MTEEEESELKKNQQQIDNEKAIASSIPPKLTCPFIEHGIHIIKDAVLVPCCGHFICCDECIREKISHEEIVECPMKDCGHEIDSLESITSHHQMRNMVNEYLNDVKLNKFNNNYNKKSSKNDDVFIDLYLNDDFKTINPNSLTNDNPVNDVNKKEIVDIQKVEKKDDEFNAENINFNEKEENDKLDRVVKSPLQDSNISSTIAVNSNNKIASNIALLPTPPMSQLIVPVSVPNILSTDNSKVFQQSSSSAVVPLISTNSIQRIGTVSKPHSPQYVENYPYMLHQGQVPRPPIMNKIRRMPNNISIPVHHPSMPHQIRGPMMNYGSMQSYDMTHTNYYQYPSNQYQANPSAMYHQPMQHMHQNVHIYNNNSNLMSTNYGVPQSFVSNNLQISNQNPNMQKHLSEKEFYEMKERLLKRE